MCTYVRHWIHMPRMLIGTDHDKPTTGCDYVCVGIYVDAHGGLLLHSFICHSFFKVITLKKHQNNKYDSCTRWGKYDHI